MAEDFAFTSDEQPFIDAIKAGIDDLAAHLAYADWLDEHDRPDHAAVLRAWVALVRLPVTVEGMDEHFAAYNAYRKTLWDDLAPWVEAVERVRKWIPKPVAEAVFRLYLNEHYGDVPSVTWPVDVSRCFFDNRWSGEYKGTLQSADGQTVAYEGTFFLDQIFGHCSGHVRKL